MLKCNTPNTIETDITTLTNIDTAATINICFFTCSIDGILLLNDFIFTTPMLILFIIFENVFDIQRFNFWRNCGIIRLECVR